MASILEADESELNDNYSLNAVNYDSLAVVATMALIDEHFGVTVDGNALRDCKTIRGLLQLIKDKTEG